MRPKKKPSANKMARKERAAENKAFRKGAAKQQKMDRKNDRFQKKAKRDSMVVSKKAGNTADLTKNLKNYEDLKEKNLVKRGLGRMAGAAAVAGYFGDKLAMHYANKTSFKSGGKVSGPFSMTKKEEDKATVDVLKGDEKFMKKAKRDEKKTQRIINRKGRGAEGLAKLKKQLRKKAERKRKKENRQQKRSNKKAARQLGRQMMSKRVGKALGRGNSISAKEAGCQGAGCGAYE